MSYKTVKRMNAYQDCSSVSYTKEIASYKKGLESLRDSVSAIEVVAQDHLSGKKVASIKSKANRAYTKAFKASKSLPTQTQSCTGS